MKTSTIARSLVLALGVTGAAYALGGCVVAARPGYVNYGYATVAQPNTVYYQGGNYGGTYYQPGYYQRSAPFFQGYGGTTVVTQPGYGQNVVVAQPVSKFVCGGADLMLPGVRAISHESLREGSLAAVKVRSEHSIFLVAYIVDIPSR